MAKSYRNIQKYEEEILKLKNERLTQREIGEKLGFSKEQIKEFLKRRRKNQRKLEAGIALKKKGRPLKDCVITEQDKVNELMRDFLSLTERK